jgi:hypothetical protein
MRLKHTVSKKTRKNKNKSHKKVRSQKRRGGGCGCESSNTVGKFFIGGTPTTNALLALPANNYYPLNDYSKDPNYLVVSSGQTGNFVKTGGKRRNHRFSRTNKRTGKHNTITFDGKPSLVIPRTPTKLLRRFSGVLTKRVSGGGYVSDATTLMTPAISATMVGASSYGLGGTSFTPPPYSMYSATNPPPSA